MNKSLSPVAFSQSISSPACLFSLNPETSAPNERKLLELCAMKKKRLFPVQNILVRANYFYRNSHLGRWFFTCLERFTCYFSCSINAWMTNRDSFCSYLIKTTWRVGNNLVCYFLILENQNSTEFLVSLGPIRYFSSEEMLGVLWPEAAVAAHCTELCWLGPPDNWVPIVGKRHKKMDNARITEAYFMVLSYTRKRTIISS